MEPEDSFLNASVHLQKSLSGLGYKIHSCLLLPQGKLSLAASRVEPHRHSLLRRIFLLFIFKLVSYF